MLTVTAKIKIYLACEQITTLKETMAADRSGCNFVSGIVFESGQLSQRLLHENTDRPLREHFSLRSQMAQSIMKTVILKYKAARSNGHDWCFVKFKKPEYDLVWNRDYSISGKLFSINTLSGRIKVPFEPKGMAHYFDGSWAFDQLRQMRSQNQGKPRQKEARFFL